MSVRKKLLAPTAITALIGSALLIFLAIMTLPCPSQAAAWLAAPAASAITAR